MPGEDQLRDVRLSRNTYQFNLRRRYQPIEHYRVKGGGEEETPLARALSGLRGKKKPFEDEKGAADAKEKGKGAKKPSGIPFGLLLGIAAVAILIFLLVIAFVFVSATPPSTPPAPPAPKPQFAASIVSNIDERGVLSYSPQEKSLYQPYLSIDIYSSGAKEVNVSASLYNSQPSRQIFILRHTRKWADTYDDFRSALSDRLAENGFPLTDIAPEQLRSLPPGSTLIVPTGFLPSFMLDDAPPEAKSAQPRPLLLSLASSGTSVVFIGQSFDTVLDGDSQVSADADKLARTGIRFDERNKPSPSGEFPLSKPLYTATSTSRDATSTMLWGPISQISYGGGSILLVPETLDGGWDKNGTNAGNDIARLVIGEPFRPRLSGSSSSLQGLSGNMSSRAYLFFSPTEAKGGFVRVNYLVSDSNGVQRSQFEDIYVQKEPLGDIYFDGTPSLMPRYLGGSSADVFVVLREQNCDKVKLYFQLLQNRTVTEYHDLETGLTQPCGKIKSNLETDQTPGSYILRLSDENDRTYASTKVDVLGVQILGPLDTPCGAFCAFRDGVFNFTFLMAGQVRPVEYVKIWSDQSAAQEFRGQSVASYRPGVNFKGSDKGEDHAFFFDFGGGYTQSITMKKIVTRAFWDDWKVQVLGVFAILIGVFGYLIRRPEKQPLSLDIPDFAPLTVKKIPMPSSAVLGIFEQINRDYAWEFMPLKTEELKGGFLKMNWGGKPIAIGDYNLERILGRLAEKGLVEQSLGYWGLAKWNAASGHSTAKRAVFRRLRDLCVTNAIRFSKLGALPYCDVKIVVGQGEYFIHFYQGDRGIISRALETVPLGRSWILFADNFEREKFRALLQSSETAPLALKMELYNYRAKLVTIDELPDLLKSLKVEGQK